MPDVSHRLATISAIALGAALSCAGPASAAQVAPKADQVSRVTFATDRDRVGPGQTVRVVILFTILPRWHAYWKDPGEGALAPRVAVTAPEGYTVGAARFTRPRVFDDPVGPVYGYEREAAIFVPVTAPDALADGEVELAVRVDYAVCKDVCVIGRAQDTLSVATSAAPVTQAVEPAPALARHERRLPRPLDALDGATATFDGSRLRVEGPAASWSAVTFFPDRTPGVEYGNVSAAVSGGRFLVTADVRVDPDNSLGEPMRVAGLVALGDRPDDPCYDFAMSVDVTKPDHQIQNGEE